MNLHMAPTKRFAGLSFREGGFTLVELMIVVAIVAAMASIALPSYTAYVLRGKTQEATATLSDLRIKMEQFYQDNRTYLDSTFCAPAAGTTKYFTYACTVTPAALVYTITATGVAAQGMTGYSYTINQANEKSSTVLGSTGATCWLTRKDDSC